MLSVSSDISSAGIPVGHDEWAAAILTYNGSARILDTIRSLQNCVPAPKEIIVIDDGSTDGTPDLVAANRPEVRIVRLGVNSGRLTKVRNAALREASRRYLLITDDDIDFRPDAVAKLMDVLTTREDAAACTPAICFEDNPQEVCNIGHDLHYLCWSARRRERTLDDYIRTGPVPAVGVGIQLVDCARVAAIGGFDETLTFGWGDDGDFHHQLRIAGLACYSVPEAQALHLRQRFSHRRYGQLHNRLAIVAKSYEWRTLIAAGPALLLFEMLLLAYMAGIGEGKDYFRAVRDVYRQRAEIRATRRRIKSFRKRHDHQILSAGLLVLPRRSAGGDAAPVRVLSRIFDLYWRLAATVLRAGAAT